MLAPLSGALTVFLWKTLFIRRALRLRSNGRWRNVVWFRRRNVSRSYFVRDYGSDSCFLRVVLDDEIVDEIRVCPEDPDFPVTCQDFSLQRKLRLVFCRVSLDRRPLPHIISEDGCVAPFCGSCECVCRDLCVTVLPFSSTLCQKVAADVSYGDCGAPLWSTVINCGSNEYNLEFRLAREEDTGKCLFGAMVNGEEQEWQYIFDCDDLSLEWQLYNGDIIRVACKDCQECDFGLIYPCECRLDATASKIAYRTLATEGCLIPGPIAGANAMMPTKNIAWNPEDCVFGPYSFLTRFTAFPPACTDTDATVFPREW